MNKTILNFLSDEDDNIIEKQITIKGEFNYNIGQIIRIHSGYADFATDIITIYVIDNIDYDMLIPGNHYFENVKMNLYLRKII